MLTSKAEIPLIELSPRFWQERKFHFAGLAIISLPLEQFSSVIMIVERFSSVNSKSNYSVRMRLNKKVKFIFLALSYVRKVARSFSPLPSAYQHRLEQHLRTFTSTT
jgi:hypothetical protein